MDQHYFGHDTGLALYEGAPPSDTFSSSGKSETLFDGETSVEDELFNKCGERGALEEVILRVDHLFDLDLDAVASAILSYAGKTELAPSHGPAVPGDSVEDAGTWCWSSSCM